MNELQKAAAILGRKGGRAGTGSAKARASEEMRAAASQRWGTVEQRFWRKVVKQDGDGCWEWIGGTNEHGYGLFWFRNKLRRATRVSWIWHNGELQDESFVLHKCDNPACIRPDHLFLGNQAINMADARRKNRVRIGEDHGMAKLSNDQVIEIRKLYKPYRKNQKELAARFGISVITFRNIVYGRCWKHIIPPASVNDQSSTMEP